MSGRFFGPLYKGERLIFSGERRIFKQGKCYSID
uniref:Uncharacterized protein n=1 Tax=Lepeophtheirus salmonis TaxID=72036 RepID=A0A0K2TVH4_LEPSM